MASEHTHWPNPAEAPASEDLARCVHCGLCVNACPTYVVTGLETESPRGRIAFARMIEDGEIELNRTVQRHWDLCLQCRACEAVCPSGVPYGRIQEHARAQVAAAPPSGRASRWVRRMVLRQVVARPRVLGGVSMVARRFASSRARRWLERSPAVRLPLVANALAQLPEAPGPRFEPQDRRTGTADALLFAGCIMREMFGDVHRATLRVLGRSGVEVAAPAGQGCCGALHAHDGDLVAARAQARQTIAAFDGYGDAAVIVNSAGCGAAMKEYGELLAGDPAWAERAAGFAARVQDLTEYLDERELPAGRLEARVTYQDPCHLAHAQRIREQPRRLLEQAGCELVETAGADMCCGAAGIYSLVQPAMSAELRSRKAEQFRTHRPEIVVTANPGCQLQYGAAVREAGIAARVMHVAEVLDEAQRAAEGAHEEAPGN